jgi:hypothetical protein
MLMSTRSTKGECFEKKFIVDKEETKPYKIKRQIFSRKKLYEGHLIIEKVTYAYEIIYSLSIR